MSKKSTTLLIIASSLCLLFGILIGVLVKDFPLLTLNTNIDIIESATLLVTIAIGILVPFLLKRWIDDSRQAKAYIVEELREFLRDINEIYDITKQIFFNSKITSADKARINTTFETVDIKLSNLLNELKDFYDKETKPMRDNLKDAYIEYWKYLTGSEIMSTRFKSIDESFYKNATTMFLGIETKIKEIIRQMYS